MHSTDVMISCQQQSLYKRRQNRLAFCSGTLALLTKVPEYKVAESSSKSWRFFCSREVLLWHCCNPPHVHVTCMHGQALFTCMTCLGRETVRISLLHMANKTATAMVQTVKATVVKNSITSRELVLNQFRSSPNGCIYLEPFVHAACSKASACTSRKFIVPKCAVHKCLLAASGPEEQKPWLMLQCIRTQSQQV